MADLSPTTRKDIPKIEEWIAVDPFHKDEDQHSAEWLLTGNGILSFCVADDQGPLCYVRLVESISESLIAFMERQGFFKAAGKNDYSLTFEEAAHV